MTLMATDPTATDVIRWALAGALAAPRRKPLPWNEVEDEFLRQNLGTLSEEEMSTELERTPVAVRLRWKRDLGLPAPSKTPGYLTACRAADALGVDVHAVCHWIEAGWLPAQILPFRTPRRVRRIRLADLKRFVIKPEHWILFRPERILDPALARLVALAVERWDDAWLTPGQVAAMHGVEHTNVNRFIHAGKLSGVKWGVWRIRRSDAARVHFSKGRGTGHELDWSEDADVFLILARAIGLTCPAIARMMKWPAQRTSARLQRLHKTGQMALVIGKYGLNVRYHQEDRYLLADWQEHTEQFPFVAQAMCRFAAGKSLAPAQAECVRGILWTWAIFHLRRDHVLVRRAHTPWGSGGPGAAGATTHLQRLHRELAALGVDPLQRSKK